VGTTEIIEFCDSLLQASYANTTESDETKIMKTFWRSRWKVVMEFSCR